MTLIVLVCVIKQRAIVIVLVSVMGYAVAHVMVIVVDALAIMLRVELHVMVEAIVVMIAIINVVRYYVLPNVILPVIVG